MAVVAGRDLSVVRTTKSKERQLIFDRTEHCRTPDLKQLELQRRREGKLEEKKGNSGVRLVTRAGA